MREVALPSQVVWSSRLSGFGEERVDEQDLVDEGAPVGGFEFSADLVFQCAQRGVVGGVGRGESDGELDFFHGVPPGGGVVWCEGALPRVGVWILDKPRSLELTRSLPLSTANQHTVVLREPPSHSTCHGGDPLSSPSARATTPTGSPR